MTIAELTCPRCHGLGKDFFRGEGCNCCKNIGKFTPTSALSHLQYLYDKYPQPTTIDMIDQIIKLEDFCHGNIGNLRQFSHLDAFEKMACAAESRVRLFKQPVSAPDISHQLVEAAVAVARVAAWPIRHQLNLEVPVPQIVALREALDAIGHQEWRNGR